MAATVSVAMAISFNHLRPVGSPLPFAIHPIIVHRPFVATYGLISAQHFGRWPVTLAADDFVVGTIWRPLITLTSGVTAGLWVDCEAISLGHPMVSPCNYFIVNHRVAGEWCHWSEQPWISDHYRIRLTTFVIFCTEIIMNIINICGCLTSLIVCNWPFLAAVFVTLSMVTKTSSPQR